MECLQGEMGHGIPGFPSKLKIPGLGSIAWTQGSLPFSAILRRQHEDNKAN
jgi:hypothetical protein